MQPARGLHLRRISLQSGEEIGASRVNKNQQTLDGWQRDLRIKIAWALAAKLLGLILLWFLFFRGRGP